MNTPGQIHVLLAEDDDDDCLLFKEVLKEFSPVKLTIAGNGESLMNLLTELTLLPDLLFLDLNMPLKNGFECLYEIKHNAKLKSLPVIIFSTSFQPQTIHEVYEGGAHYYIRKPSNYSSFRKIIQHVLSLNWQEIQSRPSKEGFILSV